MIDYSPSIAETYAAQVDFVEAVDVIIFFVSKDQNLGAKGPVWQ